MWKYLDNVTYDEFLLSFNLVKTKDIKKYKNTLYYLSNNIDGNYIEYEIPKKSGGMRKIYEPSPLLKSVQRNILCNILEEKRLSSYAKAYRKNMSIIDNAVVHVRKKVILKLDIKNFFDSITYKMVYNSCFNETLYPKPIGILLTELCTYRGILPQGAVTSSFISNVIMREFDEIIGLYCKNNDISYTRYSDDMTFSGDFNTSEAIKFVKLELNKMGLKLNDKKIRVINNNKRQVVTGIIVNEKVNIAREYKRKIRMDMYYIKKYGIDEHLRKIDMNNKIKYINTLIGKINFVLLVNPSHEFQEYINYFKRGNN